MSERKRREGEGGEGGRMWKKSAREEEKSRVRKSEMEVDGERRGGGGVGAETCWGAGGKQEQEMGEIEDVTRRLFQLSSSTSDILSSPLRRFLVLSSFNSFQLLSVQTCPADKQTLSVSAASSVFSSLISAGHHYSRAAFCWGGMERFTKYKEANPR